MKDQLDVTCYFISLIMCSTVSDINIPIFRSLRLCWWITASVVLFSVLQASACKTNTTKYQPQQVSNTQRTENKATDVVIHQHSRKLLKMGVLMSETCWAHNKWNKIASDIKLVFHSSTIAMMHGPINFRCIYTSLNTTTFSNTYSFNSNHKILFYYYYFFF